MHPNDDTPGTDHSRRTILKRATAGATAVAFGLPTLASVVAADESGVQRFTIDVTGTRLFNPCTDELMEATEGFHEIVIHERTDEGGGTHFSFHERFQVKAVGLNSGIIYYAHGGRTTSVHVHPPYPQVVTLVLALPIETRGQAPNAVIKILTKVLVNGQGEVVLQDFDQSVECG